MGGGFDTGSASDLTDIVITSNGPMDNNTWSVSAISSGSSFRVRAFAICALSH